MLTLAQFLYLFQKRAMIIGHRGCGVGGSDKEHVENTIESIQAAVEVHGCDAVEIDIQLSKDGNTIIWHDDMLIWEGREDRTMHERFISDMLLEEIRDATCKNTNIYRRKEDGLLTKFIDASKQVHVLTLSELIAWWRTYDRLKMINVELKVPERHLKDYGYKRHLVMNAMALCEGRNCIFSSFDLATVLLMKRSAPACQVLLLVSEEQHIGAQEALDLVRFVGLDGAVVHISLLEEGLQQTEKGILWCYGGVSYLSAASITDL